MIIYHKAAALHIGGCCL